MKELYAVGVVVRDRNVEVMGLSCNLELSWTAGMVGVLPVFDNKKDAERFIGKDGKIISVLIKGEEGSK